MLQHVFSKKLNQIHTVGEKIRRIRTRRKIDTTEIAESCNLSVAAIRHYENDIREPKEDTLKQIASYLGVDVSALYDRKIRSAADIMQVLFELENDGIITPFQFTLEPDNNRTGYGIRVLNEVLNEAVDLWCQKRKLWELEQISDEEYRDWQDSFPLQYIAATEQQYTEKDDGAEKNSAALKQSGDPRIKRKGGLLLRSYESRAAVLHHVSDVKPELLERICSYVNCSEAFLYDRDCIDYIPKGKPSAEIVDDRKTLYDLLSLMDKATDTERVRTIQIQLSRIVLYHLGQMGISRDDIRMRQMFQSKLDYLYSNKRPKLHTAAFGLYFTELAFIREHFDISYQEMFTGIKGE